MMDFYFMLSKRRMGIFLKKSLCCRLQCTYISLHVDIYYDLLLSADFFRINFFKNFFQEYHSLGPD